jgi:hypothetical protein
MVRNREYNPGGNPVPILKTIYSLTTSTARNAWLEPKENQKNFKKSQINTHRTIAWHPPDHCTSLSTST